MSDTFTRSEKSTTVRIKGRGPHARQRRGLAQWLVRRCPRVGALLLAELFLAPRGRRRPLVTPSSVARTQLRVGKRRIVVHHFGEGPLCLLVHGWQGGASQLMSLGESLSAAGFRVASFDMPAHGEAPGWSTSAVEFVSIIEAVARELGPIHALIGHSAGGTAALLAAARGVPVVGVVAFSPMPSFDHAVRNYARQLGLTPRARELLARRLEARTGALRSELDLTRTFPEVPTLLVHDLLDRVIPYRHSRRLQNAWQGTQLLTTCGLGHNRVLDAEPVAQDIAAFLLTLPARRQAAPPAAPPRLRAVR